MSAVSVKPLVWKDVRPDPYNGNPICETVYGAALVEYSIISRDGEWICFKPSASSPRLEDVKAACQDHYDAKVRSTLTIDGGASS